MIVTRAVAQAFFSRFWPMMMAFAINSGIFQRHTIEDILSQFPSARAAATTTTITNEIIQRRHIFFRRHFH